VIEGIDASPAAYIFSCLKPKYVRGVSLKLKRGEKDRERKKTFNPISECIFEFL